MVVRSPHLDDAVELAALEAAHQVAEVGGEVRWLAGRPDDDAALVLREHLLAEAVLLLQRGPEPKRALALLEVSALAQALDRQLGQTLRP